MDVYNFKPMWIDFIDEKKAEVGRTLTDEEVKSCMSQAESYCRYMGMMYAISMEKTSNGKGLVW